MSLLHHIALYWLFSSHSMKKNPYPYILIFSLILLKLLLNSVVLSDIIQLFFHQTQSHYCTVIQDIREDVYMDRKSMQLEISYDSLVCSWSLTEWQCLYRTCTTVRATTKAKMSLPSNSRPIFNTEIMTYYILSVRY